MVAVKPQPAEVKSEISGLQTNLGSSGGRTGCSIVPSTRTTADPRPANLAGTSIIRQEFIYIHFHSLARVKDRIIRRIKEVIGCTAASLEVSVGVEWGGGFGGGGRGGLLCNRKIILSRG